MMATGRWSDYGRSFSQFRRDRLNKPGIQIEIALSSGRPMTLLIGEVNQLGGECDHCHLVKDNTTVIRFRRLVDEEDLK